MCERKREERKRERERAVCSKNRERKERGGTNANHHHIPYTQMQRKTPRSTWFVLFLASTALCTAAAAGTAAGTAAGGTTGTASRVVGGVGACKCDPPSLCKPLSSPPALQELFTFAKVKRKKGRERGGTGEGQGKSTRDLNPPRRGEERGGEGWRGGVEG